MEPKAALSAIRDFVASSNAPDPSEGAQPVSGDAAVTAPQPVHVAEAAKPVDKGPQPGDVRLVIEQGSGAGEYIYKTVDRRTGETLNQYPREQVLRLREATDYTSGDVFDGKA